MSAQVRPEVHSPLTPSRICLLEPSLRLRLMEMSRKLRRTAPSMAPFAGSRAEKSYLHTHSRRFARWRGASTHCARGGGVGATFSPFFLLLGGACARSSACLNEESLYCFWLLLKAINVWPDALRRARALVERRGQAWRAHPPVGCEGA